MISVLLRPTSDNLDLVAELKRIEARVITWPELEINQQENQAAFDDAIKNLFGYDWLLLKNASAARFFLSRLATLNHSLDELDDLRLCVIGDETAELIHDFQVHIDLEIGSSNAVFAAFEGYLGGRGALSGLNVLAPSANIIRETYQSEFEAAGARFDCVTAYRTTTDPHALTQLNALLVGGGIDFVFFKNGAEIRELARLFDTDNLKMILRESAVICADQSAGPAFAAFGLAHVLKPSDPTTDAIRRLISSDHTTRQ